MEWLYLKQEAKLDEMEFQAKLHGAKKFRRPGKGGGGFGQMFGALGKAQKVMISKEEYEARQK